MSKKKRIVIYVILGIVVWNSIFLVAYFFMNKHVKNTDYHTFVKDCYEYVKNDTDFISKYGMPIDFSYSKPQEIQKTKGKDGNIEPMITFYIEVDTGKTYSVKMVNVRNGDFFEFVYREIVESE